MGITREDVLHVARLARLKLDPQEVARFTEQLDGILGHLEAISALPPAEESDVRSGPAAAPLRADEPAFDALAFPPSALAPSWQGGFFAVPRLGAMDVAELAEEGG